ncbi:hypothetical protein H072_1457 [Dactylellina haptotyla CBS 200.50]|uniref:PH domain-containing protein n=1 Tax=Dactylellina haptotyla (strain CBS 200.50) TaxID=1284197 RepID=S8ANV2_DACHA|nr:hypothetical protein H072_1457 [Dactylellina haptotyla CBS 200.50]
MTSYLTKFVLGRIFKESAANKEGREDPYYEYPATELGKAGKRKSKRRKRALPPGLTDEEGEVLTKVKRRAYRLDMSFGSFLGVRFGWGSVLGIIPALGDALDLLLALMVVKTCMKLPLPTFTLIHMLINVAFDFVIGLVPFIGDIIDAGYKCNTRNAVILEKHLRQVGKERLKAQGITDAQDPSLPTGDESPVEDVDLEAQAPAAHRGGNRDRRERERERERDDRRDDRGATGPAPTHSKSKKKLRSGRASDREDRRSGGRHSDTDESRRGGRHSDTDESRRGGSRR